MRLMICIALLLTGINYGYAQKYYLVNNENPKKIIELASSQLYLQLEVPGADSTETKVWKNIGCTINGCNKEFLFVSKFFEEKEVQYKDGRATRIITTFLDSNHKQASVKKDTIRVADILTVGRNGGTGKSQAPTLITGLTGIGLIGVLTAGPFIFKQNYFSAVGVALVCAIPIITTCMILDDDKFKLKGNKKGLEKNLWHLEYHYN
jgi:hypothetical protein